MTKNKYLILSGSLAIIVAVTMFYKDSDHSIVEGASKEITPNDSVSKTKADSTSAPTLSPRSPASVGFINKPSDLWQKRLETSLKDQAGDSLKDIQIKKERSLTWTRDEVPLSVESVVITLTNQKDEESSFRALVDSQTGKVLETWDRTIFDPADVRAGFQIKLKENYSN